MSILKTGLKRACNMDESRVALARLKREIDRGFEFFLDKRPHLRRLQSDGFGSWVATPGKKYCPRDIAEAYLAIERPARGTLQRMAAGVGLKYPTVWAAVSTVRKLRKASAREELAS